MWRIKYFTCINLRGYRLLHFCIFYCFNFFFAYSWKLNVTKCIFKIQFDIFGWSKAGNLWVLIYAKFCIFCLQKEICTWKFIIASYVETVQLVKDCINRIWIGWRWVVLRLLCAAFTMRMQFGIVRDADVKQMVINNQRKSKMILDKWYYAASACSLHILTQYSISIPSKNVRKCSIGLKWGKYLTEKLFEWQYIQWWDLPGLVNESQLIWSTYFWRVPIGGNLDHYFFCLKLKIQRERYCFSGNWKYLCIECDHWSCDWEILRRNKYRFF